MELKLDNYQDGWGGALVCPNCKGTYLHQVSVDYFDRQEDAQQGTHILVQNGTATLDTNMSGNPSKRREGIVITFDCENCEATPRLTIAQHKGNSLVDITA